ncbi:MAG: YceI family protein [Rubritepida sp.]|nr:YceI family protein [Rubritepida sp.]
MPIPRRALLALPALAASAAPALGQRTRYDFTEREGEIGFTARHLGVMSSQGRFQRFRATLFITPDRPTDAEVLCEVETASATVPFPGAEELLRSAPFFDVDNHPLARFSGTATGAGAAPRFPISGSLTIRAITRPFALEGRLLGRERDAEGEAARFEAAGRMSRTAFGMTAERALISDEIGLSVRVRIRV